jgi:hypothetical protein
LTKEVMFTNKSLFRTGLVMWFGVKSLMEMASVLTK